MKYFIFLILTSCGIDVPVIPDCKHSIEIEQGQTEDILHLEITSDLECVWVTVQDYPRKRIGRDYYECISFHIKKDECYIKIEAEETCEYIY